MSGWLGHDTAAVRLHSVALAEGVTLGSHMRHPGISTSLPHLHRITLQTLNQPHTSSGQGTEGLRAFYARHFIPKMPSDVTITPIERNVGVDAKGGESVVDEFLFSFTHDTVMDWMLPGVQPTGKKGKGVFVCGGGLLGHVTLG